MRNRCKWFSDTCLIVIIGILGAGLKLLYELNGNIDTAINMPVVQDEANMREINPNDKNDGLVLMYDESTGECKVCRVKDVK